MAFAMSLRIDMFFLVVFLELFIFVLKLMALQVNDYSSTLDMELCLFAGLKGGNTFVPVVWQDSWAESNFCSVRMSSGCRFSSLREGLCDVPT